MAEWTETEIKTLVQNMHLPSSVIATAINRSASAIETKRRRMVGIWFAAGMDVKSKLKHSLQKRGWTVDQQTWYILACQGNASALDKLRSAGLWHNNLKVG